MPAVPQNFKNSAEKVRKLGRYKVRKTGRKRSDRQRKSIGPKKSDRQPLEGQKLMQKSDLQIRPKKSDFSSKKRRRRAAQFKMDADVDVFAACGRPRFLASKLVKTRQKSMTISDDEMSAGTAKVWV